MPNNPLFYPVREQSPTKSLHDQIQLALAIAEETSLKSLVTNCIPPLAEQHLINKVSAQVGVPTDYKHAADGILHIEVTKCFLASPEEAAELESITKDNHKRPSKESRKYTRCESELAVLAQNLSLAQAEALLADAGFSPKPIQEILNLPTEAWHKSWWYALDPSGNFTPFLRFIRPVRYPNGTFTLQYKDYFEQDKPYCFKNHEQRILVKIQPEIQKFGKTLEQINYYREALGVKQAVLVCNTISDVEAQGFINQGISVYPAFDLVLPTQADCVLCARRECLMNGAENSPVAKCYGFLLEASCV